VAFEFDPMGRLLRRTDQLGDTVTMSYDLASRMLQRDYRTRVNSPSGTISDSDVMNHDRMGRMATGVSGRYSNTVAMSYDDQGRPASESLTISGQTYTTSYAHDAMNRRSGMTYPDGSAVLRTYTNRSQLHQAKLNGVTLDTRTYDAGGRHSTSTYGNGVVITHAYRTNGSLKDDLLASITTTHPGGIPSGQQVGDYTYTWDANRNKLSESITGILSGRGFQPVTYDNEERLTAWSRSDGNQGQTWSLSLVGDWTTHAQTGTVAFTQNRVHGPAHEFTSFSGTSSGTLTYDVKGNATSRPATLAAPALNLTWDFGNQLSGVDTNGTPASQEVTFRYDVLGRRVGRVEGGSSIVFVQAGLQTIADYAAGQLPTKPNQIYVYGSYIDEPIARRESGNLAYFHRNQQYSIVALTNATGAVIERYSYTAHGQLTIYNAAGTILAASAFDNRYTYTGREWDQALAMHFFRARWYDPLAGRFISRDPLGYVDGMGLYPGYFAISLNQVDPLGNDIKPYVPGAFDWTSPECNDHHWFARNDKSKQHFLRHCGPWLEVFGIAVDDFVDLFTTRYPGPWKRGSAHTTIHKTPDGRKFLVEFDSAAKTSKDCCELLKKVKDLMMEFHRLVLLGPDVHGPIQPPALGPYQKILTGNLTNDILDRVIDIVCNRKLPSTPQPSWWLDAIGESVPEIVVQEYSEIAPLGAPQGSGWWFEQMPGGKWQRNGVTVRPWWYPYILGPSGIAPGGMIFPGGIQ
jgi:RHS repeat-associated protein